LQEKKNHTTMSNNKQSSVEWLLSFIEPSLTQEQKHFFSMVIEQAKAMQKQQAEHYATFITNCVINNLPTITFNDWINLHNNEQQ
jgi:hypothetical protein